MFDVGEHSAVGDLTSPDNCIQYIRLPSASFTGSNAQCCCCLDTVCRDRLLNYSSDISVFLASLSEHLRSLVGRMSHILVSLHPAKVINRRYAVPNILPKQP